MLPSVARTELSSWVSSSLVDSRACYTAFFESQPEQDGHPQDLPLQPPPDILLRTCIGHDGVSGIRRLVVSFLVYPKANTRRLLREMAAFEDNDPAVLTSAALPDEASLRVARAVARVAAVRAAWVDREEEWKRQKEASGLNHLASPRDEASAEDMLNNGRKRQATTQAPTAR